MGVWERAVRIELSRALTLSPSHSLTSSRGHVSSPISSTAGRIRWGGGANWALAGAVVPAASASASHEMTARTCTAIKQIRCGVESLWWMGPPGVVGGSRRLDPPYGSASALRPTLGRWGGGKVYWSAALGDRAGFQRPHPRLRAEVAAIWGASCSGPLAALIMDA